MSDERKSMTDEELAEIKGRLAAITEWPWIVFCRTGVGHRMGITNKRLFDDDDAPEVLDVVELGEDAGGIKSEADAAFIANAPTDIARLLAENERLRQEVARLELENQRLTVAGANDEAYLLTCLDIIRKAVGMPVGSDWQQVAERVERLDKEADWLVKIMFFYTEECPLKMKIQDELPIPKLDGCDGTWPDDDYFDCTNSTPEKCWREAARKAVEDENG